MFANGWTWIGFLIFAISWNVKAEIVTIFDVRNTLPLSDTEPLYRDYYINAGSERGLRPGMIVTVKRKIALYDSYRNKSPGDLHIQVGKVKIILVQDGLSVARDHATIARTSHPLLEYDFVMAGDELDLATVAPDTEGKKSAGPGEPAEDKKVGAAQPDPEFKKEAEPRAPAEAPKTVEAAKPATPAEKPAPPAENSGIQAKPDPEVVQNGNSVI